MNIKSIEKLDKKADINCSNIKSIKVLHKKILSKNNVYHFTRNILMNFRVFLA